MLHSKYINRISKRESLAIVKMRREGMAQKEVADILGICVTTVVRHSRGKLSPTKQGKSPSSNGLTCAKVIRDTNGITPEKRQLVVLLANKTSDANAARHYNVSPSSVGKWRRLYSVQGRKGGRLTKAEEALLPSDYITIDQYVQK